MDFDPRDRDDDARDVEMLWIDVRQCDADQDRHGWRDRDKDSRDRDEGLRARDDPRDPFVDGLELPRGRERETVLDGDRRYELNGDDSRSLATIGAFRVVPEADLRDPGDEMNARAPELRHLREQGLVRFVALKDRDRAVTLTKRGHHLLEAHRRDGDDAREQSFHAGVSRPRELSHDAQLYGA